jgi:GLPGLI family protein
MFFIIKHYADNHFIILKNIGMKRLLLSFFSVAFIITVNAQTIELNKGEFFDPKLSKLLIIDTVTMRIKYRQSIMNDTLNINSGRTNIMILQVGRSMSKYTDYNALVGDSIITEYTKQGKDVNEIISKTLSITRGASHENIFKDYPKGKITTTNFFLGSSYLYEEPFVKINWKLESGNMTIAGYKCKKASISLFGRKYTAWYTPDIPVGNGPWKFSGLPGLILKAEDDRKQVSFECIAIEKPRWVDQIYIFDKDYLKTNKKTFLKSYKQYRENPGAALQNSGMVQGDIPARALRKRAYNPIELSE